MCGITGFWGGGSEPGGHEAIARGMARAISYRGPDSDGSWSDAEARIALGHRRLAILDLSPHGHQPMHSTGGRYVIVFNGEIYNFQALRRELEPHTDFRGHSDTEVILAAIQQWGLDRAVERFVGMFAFALWDRERRELHLVRDRVGIKPLYYGWTRGVFLFGSELKAFHAHPDFEAEIDRNALALFMRYNCVPAPHAIFMNARKLLPGTILTIRSPNDRAADARPFWSARAVAEAGLANPFEGSDEEAAEELDRLLRDAVDLRMIADVPLGAFLSGGIDSSLVVALMQAQSTRPVRTFSIGSPDAGYDEAQHAKLVAQHLGTHHTELYVTADDALAVIPRLPAMFDEPFADSSQIPTYLVSQLARRHVTVALSGDGGDELFGGYNRHVWGQRIWSLARRVPESARIAGARAIGAIAPATWDSLFARLGPVLPGTFKHRMPGYKLGKLADVLGASTPAAMYQQFTSHWSDPESLVLGAREPESPMRGIGKRGSLGGLTTQMMYMDLVSYLPDDVLTKVDRASMAVSLEARVPLLDHRVVELAWRIPLSMKIRDGQGKWLLRRVLDRYVPRELIDRPKTGFGVPLDAWLRGPLRGWAEALIDERRLRQEGFLDAGRVRAVWREHLEGRRSWQYHLWDVLMFQSWLQEWRGVAAAASRDGALRSIA
ncbi:MAG: asparagine synthase (glutamine-hydrolyzing) [Gemmatimonadaceae bacterium]